MNQKDQKLKEILRELSAQFFSKTSNRQSLITVTDVEILSKGGRANILVTVLPESMEQKAVEFANRQLTDFRQFVHDNSRIARIPYFEVKVDIGEKNRQRIEEIEKDL